MGEYLNVCSSVKVYWNISHDVMMMSLNFHSREHLPHVFGLYNQFFLKRLSKHRSTIADRGKLSLYFVFVDSSEDFEHVESPNEVMAQTTPTQTPGEGASNHGELERENSGHMELPPGWEERTVS